MGLGPQELIVIFLIVLLLFGGKKIPEIARGMGRGLREFRKARDEIKDSIEEESTTNGGEDDGGEKPSSKSETPSQDAADEDSDRSAKQE